MSSNALQPKRILSERTAFYLLWAGLVALFVYLTRTTWMRWGDPVVDTGREVEIAWKVASGKVLYRDMAYNYGPFSTWVNALFLKLFGMHLTSIVIGGLCTAAAGVLLVYRTARIFLHRNLAVVLAAVFLLEAVFQHYFFNGNFNFILPYSFPAVHAMLAALGALIFLAKFIDGNGRRHLAAAGALCGIALLCKIEIAGAIIVAVALIPLLQGLSSRQDLKRILADALAWAVPLLTLVAAGFLPYIAAASFEQVVWENVLKPQLVDFRSNIFFQKHLGVDQLMENLSALVQSMGGWVGVVILAAVSAKLWKKPGIGITAMAALIGAVVVAWLMLPYKISFRCVPLVAVAAGGLAGYRIFVAKRDADRSSWKLLALAVFSFLALLRILLTTGTFHYGFCLALPGVLLFAVVLIHYLPGLFPFRITAPGIFAWIVAGILLILATNNFLGLSRPMYDHRSIKLETPTGMMMVQPGPFGLNLHPALEHLIEQGRPGETLVVLPEGALVNFLTQQPNPLYYNLFIPPELNAPGVEQDVIDSINAEAVDRILIIDRDVSEYGFRGLGIDYGKALTATIRNRYDLEAAFGPPPYGPRRGGVAIYRRKP